MGALDAFAAAYARLPAQAKSAARDQALQRLLAVGLPDRSQEDWKYTDLGSLAAHAPEELPQHEVAQVGLAQDADGVDALNAAFCTGGLDQQVTAGSKGDAPLIAGGRGHRRHRVRIATNVHAALKLDTDPGAAFQSVFLDLHLEAGARLDLLRIQDAAAEARHVTRIRATLERDATLDVTSVDFGGQLSRHDLQVRLEGPGACTQLRALFHADDAAHIDNHTRFDHLAPHGTSRERVHGLAGGRSRGVFNGKIVVHPGAQKTDSEQHVASLLLSPRSEINAKPELEIYADDVKCAHGATFGQLDERALFYLRSRGLPREQARAILMLAFALAPLREIPDTHFREQVLQLASAHFGATLDEVPA